MTTLAQLAALQASKEVVVNELFETLSAFGIFGKRHEVTEGLTWGYYGGIWPSGTVANGTAALAASTTNYVVVELATGEVSVSTSTTDWDDDAFARLYKITTGADAILPNGVEDYRAGSLFGPPTAANSVSAADVSITDAAGDFTADNVEGALAELQADAEAHIAASDPHPQYLTQTEADALYVGAGEGGVTDHGALTGLGDDDHPQYAKRSLTINTQSGDYSLVLTDAATKMVEIASASPNNLTVPANASVAFPIGTTVLVKQGGAGQTTVVAAGGVTVNVRAALTLSLAGQYAVATLIKEATDTWLLAGDLEVA